jgi:hypothetical protein
LNAMFSAGLSWRRYIDDGKFEEVLNLVGSK